MKLMSFWRRPLAHAVCYIDDGVREVDIRQRADQAQKWAEWCRRDGCTEVEIHPLYTEEEVRLARYSVITPSLSTQTPHPDERLPNT